MQHALPYVSIQHAYADKLRIKRYKQDKNKRCATLHWFPVQPQPNLNPVPDLPATFVTQNVHPALALFDARLQTDTLSHEDLCTLLAPDNEMQLLNLLSDTGVIAKKQHWKY